MSYDPNDVAKLSYTYYGDPCIVIPAKSSLKTQEIRHTYYGKIISSNDYVSGAAPPAESSTGFFMFF